MHGVSDAWAKLPLRQERRVLQATAKDHGAPGLVSRFKEAVEDVVLGREELAFSVWLQVSVALH